MRGACADDVLDVASEEGSKEERERERHNKYRVNKGGANKKEVDGGGDEGEMSEADFKCILCGHSGGAVKPTADGRWAHVLCALWLPDAAFMDATIMVSSFPSIPPAPLHAHLLSHSARSLTLFYRDTKLHTGTY